MEMENNTSLPIKIRQDLPVTGLVSRQAYQEHQGKTLHSLHWQSPQDSGSQDDQTGTFHFCNYLLLCLDMTEYFKFK